MHRLIAAALALVALPALARQDAPKKHAGFERMKELVGTWESAKEGGMGVTYRLTAGGSALLETIAPGGDHEMLTLYTLDGDDLVLTHYCVLGNQPRMKAEKSDKTDVLRFTCVGGGNMKCDKDKHMHSAVFHLEEKDTLESEWTMQAGGMAAGAVQMSLKRKK